MEIRRDFIPRKFGVRKLAEKYGVSMGCISGVIYNNSYRQALTQ